MKTPLLLGALSFALALRAQPPAIHQERVFNAASHIPPSLPGGALAPGSRIIIEGLRFGSAPRVNLEAQGKEFAVRILSAGPERIEALLPASVPSGRGEITVDNPDGRSRPFSVRIAAASFGIYSANGKSWGPAAFAEAPAGRIAILGTGLGPANEIAIFVGGKQARVVAIAPSEGQPGIDRVEFEVPSGAPTGCFVPVVARTPEGAVSNTVSIVSGPCTPGVSLPIEGAPAGDTAALLFLARFFDWIKPYSASPVEFTEDLGAGIFAPASVLRSVLNPWRLMPPPGACTAYTGRFYGDPGETTLPGFFSAFVGAAGRDAGAFLSILGPRGEAHVPGRPDTRGFYEGQIGVDKALMRPGPPLFLSPSEYTVAWPGGPDVPRGQVRMRLSPPFSWTNAHAIETVERGSGVTVAWRGTPPGQRMGIFAVSVDPQSTALGACFCLARADDRHFTIPALMLANLAKTPDEPGLPMSLLVLAPLPELQRFVVPGAAHGLALATNVQVRSVTYR
jgi:uncharacterized protein (TIGR03437 family)